MENTEARYELTGAGIDDAGEAAYSFLTAEKVERKDALRVRLALEEALLRYRDENNAGGGSPFAAAGAFAPRGWSFPCPAKLWTPSRREISLTAAR